MVAAQHTSQQQPAAQRRSKKAQQPASAALNQGELLPLAVRLGPALFPHHLFVKEHKNAQAPSSLFVAGLPLGMGQRALEYVASCFGDAPTVVVHGSKKSAMIAFAEEDSVAAALSAARQGQLVEIEQPDEEGEEQAGRNASGLSEATGLRAWVNAHKAKRPGHEELQRQLDAWVAQHEEEEARAERAQQAAMAEDGWTVVVRSKGRKRTKESDAGTIQSGGVAAAAARAMAKENKSAPLEDFYRFQQREKRRNELVELRTKFEEDRHRIQGLRATRNFKPF